MLKSYDNSDNVDYASQQASIDNPLHSDVTKGAKKTPLEVQLGLTLLPVRYLPRAFAKTATDSAAPQLFHKYSGINLLRDKLYLPGYLDRINTHLNTFEAHIPKLFPNGTASMTGQELMEKMRATPEGNKLIAGIADIQRKWDAGDLAENTVEHFLRHRTEKGGRTITTTSKLKLRSKMSEMLFETAFDTMLGLGSFWYTRKVQNNVHQDVMSIYSEAVSFESGKDHNKINDDDIVASNNEIIQSTVKNYRTKRFLRHSISALPFLKHVPSLRAMQWGEATVAGWGIMWAQDIMGRNPTMLENFRSFINDKLNPLYGIGDPVRSSEIIDLYQQYAYRFNPEIAFRSISVNDEDANRMWAQSEKVFSRIAALMNESYNFKHLTELDPDTNTPIVKADFTLPKFIYLLGHGLINARKPEWSMAFIELANKFPDMEAVKEATQVYRSNGNLSDIVEKYGIDLNPDGHVNGIVRGILLPKLDAKQADKSPEPDIASAPNAQAETEPSPAERPEGEQSIRAETQSTQTHPPKTPANAPQKAALSEAESSIPQTEIETKHARASNLNHSPTPQNTAAIG